MSDPQRAVLVTGIAGGIGGAVGARLRRDGFWVLGVDRSVGSDEACDANVQANLETFGSSHDAGVSVLQGIRDRLQGRLLHAAVHAAAIQIIGPLDALSLADFERTLTVNLLAPFELTRSFREDLRRARGSVVFVSSIHSELSKPDFALYSVSKAALSGLTRALALELAPDVRVNEVSPAATNTPMLRAGFGDRWPSSEKALSDSHPLRRIAAPDEVANVVAFLLSEQASFVTGARVAVGGGIHVRLYDPS
jgi:NAD(P)-dependent dehydrogenase (short-subunit alcohol dehydrogenase family)